MIQGTNHDCWHEATRQQATLQVRGSNHDPRALQDRGNNRDWQQSLAAIIGSHHHWHEAEARSTIKLQLHLFAHAEMCLYQVPALDTSTAVDQSV
jgi:hypothetical protein